MNNPQTSAKIKASVGVLTFNNELTLEKCLESVADFAEIVICDGGSTDRTIELATQFGCTVIQQDDKFKYENNKIADFSGVRNQMLQAATQNWFLFVDSDEYLSLEVVEEIRKIVSVDSSERPKVYDMPRKYTIDGVIIDCASVYPSYQTRFFHREYVTNFVKNVHERIQIKEGVTVGKLKHPTIVPTSIDYKEIKKKHRYYLKIEEEKGKSADNKYLLVASTNNLKYSVTRLIKLFISYVTCRGTRMPIYKEIIATRYTLRLSFVLFRLLVVRLLRL